VLMHCMFAGCCRNFGCALVRLAEPCAAGSIACCVLQHSQVSKHQTAS
jgi:hypothetical protein